MSKVELAVYVDNKSFNKDMCFKFAQKQNWLKELEKARKIIVSNENKITHSLNIPNRKNLTEKSIQAKNESTDEYSSKEDVCKFEKKYLPVPSSAIVKISEEIRGVVNEQKPMQFNFCNFNDTKTYQGRLQVNKVEKHISAEILTSKQMSNYQVKNLSVILSENGLKIIFRDYRATDNEISKVIFKIKENIKALKIPIESVLVNGHVYSDHEVSLGG